MAEPKREKGITRGMTRRAMVADARELALREALDADNERGQ